MSTEAGQLQLSIKRGPDLKALVAFVAEHQRCGELDGGVDGERVWEERETRRLPIQDAIKGALIDTSHSSPSCWREC
jgi:hypothetical protein